jgi:hypothetical protein
MMQNRESGTQENVRMWLKFAVQQPAGRNVEVTVRFLNKDHSL